MKRMIFISFSLSVFLFASMAFAQTKSQDNTVNTEENNLIGEREKLEGTDFYKKYENGEITIEYSDGKPKTVVSGLRLFDDEEYVYELYCFIQHGGDSYNCLMTKDGKIFPDNGYFAMRNFYIVYFGDVKVYALTSAHITNPLATHNAIYYDTQGNKIDDIESCLSDKGEKFENGIVKTNGEESSVSENNAENTSKSTNYNRPMDIVDSLPDEDKKKVALMTSAIIILSVMLLFTVFKIISKQKE